MTPLFHDNVRVKTDECGAEFLAITFYEKTDDYIPYTVSMTRYCVPGRLDIYRFDRVRRTMRFSSDIRPEITLADAIKLARADLQKPQVVELVGKAFRTNRNLARTLYNILWNISPQSDAARSLLALIQGHQGISRQAAIPPA